MSPAPITEARRLDLSPDQRAAVEARQEGQRMPADVKAAAVAAIKAGNITVTEAAADLRVSVGNVSDWCGGRKHAGGRGKPVEPAEVVPDVVPADGPLQRRDRAADVEAARLRRAASREGAAEAQDGADAPAAPTMPTEPEEAASAPPALAGGPIGADLDPEAQGQAEAEGDPAPEAHPEVRPAAAAAAEAQEAPEGSPAPTMPGDPAGAASASATPAAQASGEADPEAGEGDGIAAPLRAIAEEAAARDAAALGVPVHPLAALFPMVTGEDFARMVEDVRQHGVQLPVTFDQFGRLLDGRNRYAAAKEAGRLHDMPEPLRLTVTGAEARREVMRANDLRRHMTAGQRTMVYAMAHPEPTHAHGGKRVKGSTSARNLNEPSAGYLSQARAVLRHSIPLALDVLAGRLSVEAAKAKADAEQAAARRKAAEAERAKRAAEAPQPEAPAQPPPASVNLAAAKAQEARQAKASASSPAPAASTSTTASAGAPAEEAPPAAAPPLPPDSFADTPAGLLGFMMWDRDMPEAAKLDRLNLDALRRLRALLVLASDPRPLRNIAEDKRTPTLRRHAQEAAARIVAALGKAEGSA